MLNTIYSDAKVTIVALKADADNEAINGAIIDMSGYEVVEFIFGILEGDAANHSIKVQQGATSNLADAADLAGTATTVAATVSAKGLGVVAVVRPEERYLRPVLTVANINAVPAFCLAIQHTARTAPVTKTGDLFNSPVEGTA